LVQDFKIWESISNASNVVVFENLDTLWGSYQNMIFLSTWLVQNFIVARMVLELQMWQFLKLGHDVRLDTTRWLSMQRLVDLVLKPIDHSRVCDCKHLMFLLVEILVSTISYIQRFDILVHFNFGDKFCMEFL
jgi:hypothetical protein